MKTLVPAVLTLIAIAVAGCQRSPGEVMEKVKYDFGIGEKPEGYVTGADQVMDRLDNVGKTELKRLNMDSRHGGVEFQGEGLQGQYYKQKKVYEEYTPIDARAITRTASGDRGFFGYVRYSYVVYQSERKTSRTEAESASANIRTTETGYETYRYKFSVGGIWDGGEGEPVST